MPTLGRVHGQQTTLYVEYPLRTGAPSSMVRLRGRPSSTAPYSHVVGEMTYPYDCIGHNRSILSANDVYISPIDGAIDIVLLGWCRKRKCHRRSGLWLVFSYSITDLGRLQSWLIQVPPKMDTLQVGTLQLAILYVKNNASFTLDSCPRELCFIPNQVDVRLHHVLTMLHVHLVWDVCIAGNSQFQCEGSTFSRQNRPFVGLPQLKKAPSRLDDGKEVVLTAAAVNNRGPYTTINRLI